MICHTMTTINGACRFEILATEIPDTQMLFIHHTVDEKQEKTLDIAIHIQ